MKKKTKNLILYGVGIAFVVGIVALLITNGSNSDNPSLYSASQLSVLESEFDFGTILMGDGNVSHAFEMKNEGEETVRINKVYTSCMCTTAFVTNISGKKYGEFGMLGHSTTPRTNIEVAPGESAIVEVIFDPAAHGPSGVGKVKRIIYLETNSQVSPKMQFSIEAKVVN